ncbi:LOW QUALITY PROTEIN: erythroferrone-like [Falco peregrinus]|uniref:LOW QUALITY PROTEIN: erythroferrone-like n=1 Tax=Falco peregrinus TaxID=8954 RepID=UPI002479E740|nr:LOW QUALITY PROTEIN: erythroferrone-like [Falco peregrinus]
MSQPRHRSMAHLARLGRVTVPEAPHTRAEEPSRGAPRTPRGLAREGARPGGGSGALGAPAAGRARGALASPEAGPGPPSRQRRRRDAAAGAVPGSLRRRPRDRLHGGGPGAATGRGSSCGEGGVGGTRGAGGGRSPGRRRGPPAGVDAAGREPRPGEQQPGPGQDGHSMVKEQVKTRRKAWEGREEEEESEGNPQAGSHRRVEAAFRCQTCENISIEQRARLELQLYYIPEKEGMFHCGPGLNLTSGRYTVPITGYYTFTATLHIGSSEEEAVVQGNRLRVLICVQSCCQHNSNLETVSGPGESGSDHFTISVTGVLYLQEAQLDSTPVFVDNTAGSPLTIQSGSDFSAILLGV